MKIGQNYKKALLCFLTLLPAFNLLSAQHFFVGFGVGGMNYQGDLTTPEVGEAFAITQPALTIQGGYLISEHFALKLEGTFGKLIGNDRFSPKEYRNQRNLSFQSKITEIACKLDWNILSFSGDNAGHKFTPFLSAGAGIIFFDPKTTYSGELIRLQPLGTEGQGLPQYPDREKYALHTIVIPVGGGLRAYLNDEITISLDVSGHYTFTDYLDDVSTTYVNYYELLEGNGPLAAALGNRTGEYYGTTPQDNPSGGKRGNLNMKDSYFSGILSLQFNLAALLGQSGRPGCPTY